MIKGLKKLGILALSAVIAMGTVTAVLPAKEVWAENGVYEPLTHGAVVKDWEFQSGLVCEGSYTDAIIVSIDKDYQDEYSGLIGQIARGKTVKFGKQNELDPNDNQFGLVVKFTQGYKSYDGELFDIYIRLTTGPSYNDAGHVFTIRNNVAGTAGNGSLCIMKSGVNTWISICTGFTDGDGTDFNYEVWLRHNPMNSDPSDIESDDTSWDSPLGDLDRKELFVGGSCFNAGLDVGNNNSSEAVRPWSSDGIFYSNDNLKDNAHHWFYSVGYDFTKHSGKTPFDDIKTEANGVWISDRHDSTNAPDVFSIGYGYTENHSIKGGYTNKVITGKSSGVAELLLGYRVRKIIFEVAPGDLGYKNPDDMRIAKDEYLEGSVVSRKTEKPYNGGNTYMPSGTDHFGGNSGTNERMESGYQFAYWTTKQDVYLIDGSGNVTRTIKAGEKITEADMPYVRIEGDPEKPDLVFYAHTAKPGPDPEPTPDSPSDSGSTPASATVAPAAPAPLPAGTVRVSPKTGDTTIPPIYYVMSVVALAGIGFLVFRRRGKN